MMDEDLALKQSLERFSQSIDRYRETLNQEGIWLFLATLGCWSVQGFVSSVFALLLTFLLFTYRVYNKVEYRKTFNATLGELRNEVGAAKLPELIKKERLADILELEKTKLTNYRHIAKTPIFLVCYGFLAFTLVQRLFGFSW